MNRNIHITTKSFLYFIVFCFIVACNNKVKEVDALQAEVIKVHDEVMPKMDEIMKLQSQVKAIKADTTQELSSDQIGIANNIIVSLIKADEGMMNWMRNYDSMMQGMSDDEKITYLKKQEISIKKVKQDMLSAISEAEKFVIKYKN